MKSINEAGFAQDVVNQYAKNKRQSEFNNPNYASYYPKDQTKQYTDHGKALIANLKAKKMVAGSQKVEDQKLLEKQRQGTVDKNEDLRLKDKKEQIDQNENMKLLDKKYGSTNSNQDLNIKPSLATSKYSTDTLPERHVRPSIKHNTLDDAKKYVSDKAKKGSELVTNQYNKGSKFISDPDNHDLVRNAGLGAGGAALAGLGALAYKKLKKK